MSEFYVEDSKLRGAASDLKRCSNKIDRLTAEISRVSLLCGFQGAEGLALKRNLNTLKSRLQKNSRSLNNMGTDLKHVAKRYRDAEYNAIDYAMGREHIGFIDYLICSLQDMGPLTLAVATMPGVSAFSVLQIFRHWWNDENISHFGLEARGWKTTDKSYSGSFDFGDYQKKYKVRDKGLARKASRISSKINKFNDKHQKKASIKFINLKKVNPKNKKQMREFEDLTDRQIFDGVDVNIANVGVKKENSLWRADGIAGDADGTHASGSIRVLNADAEASAYIGLGGMGVAAGASVSLLHAEGEGQLGNNMLGLYGKAEVDALKAELSGDASIGFVGKDGKFNPSAHIGAKAEAIAVEASAKGGVKVLGTDVGVKAGVNVGVGAHADIGLKDGKFTADLGASLGVGVSLKVEVDVSGTIDAVSGAAKSALDNAGKVLDGAGKMLGEMGKGFFGLFKK
ncbi:MAG: hypothetical protein K5697_01570 [Lachnospiraceae bacterium]|nr:hypothetical protein [Lachnospiraceae bacterium]